MGERVARGDTAAPPDGAGDDVRGGTEIGAERTNALARVLAAAELSLRCSTPSASIGETSATAPLRVARSAHTNTQQFKNDASFVCVRARALLNSFAYDGSVKFSFLLTYTRHR